jgi:PhoPQ-activated pathogenicity-related protein
MNTKPFFLCTFFWLVSLVLAYAADPPPKQLDEYLALPDTSFSWKIIRQAETLNHHTFLVEMTSQTWHGITWKHYMYIAEPSNMVNSGNCILYIVGGSNKNWEQWNLSDENRMITERLATISGSAVAMLFQVPNQPLFGDHVEDSLIGETLLKALNTEDSTWPLLFPMTKSAIRAMDTVQELFKKERNKEIKNFVVTGASKRGWTTWLTGASKDKRVLAIAPFVINTLNMRRQMSYQKETWGDYSLQVADYTTRNLIQDHNTELTGYKQLIWKMVDPYSYLSRLTMPKLLVHGTNDEYWTVDATQFYWNDLEGVKFILNLPNVGHGLTNREQGFDERIKALQTLAAFTRYACSGNEWPDMTWKRTSTDNGITVTVDSNVPVNAAKLWTVQSETKDFRKSKWTSQSLSGYGSYTASIPRPASGHIAYYVELETEYEGIPCSLTTEVWRD